MAYFQSTPSAVPMLRLRVIIVAFCASFVAANTEIRNFEVGLVTGYTGSRLQTSPSDLFLRTALQAEVHTLNATHKEQSFATRPAPLGTTLRAVCEPDITDDYEQGAAPLSSGCPHELWLELELGAAEWAHYDRFTIRLSWPAFYPADFDITLFSPEELLGFIRERLRSRRKPTIHSLDGDENLLSSYNASSTLRTKYARIRLVDTGVRSPSTSESPTPSDQTEPETVPFTIIVEPLLFGVLPASLVPIILSLIPLLLVVGLAYPYVIRYLDSVASEARKELYGSGKPKQE